MPGHSIMLGQKLSLNMNPQPDIHVFVFCSDIHVFVFRAHVVPFISVTNCHIDPAVLWIKNYGCRPGNSMIDRDFFKENEEWKNGI